MSSSGKSSGGSLAAKGAIILALVGAILFFSLALIFVIDREIDSSLKLDGGFIGQLGDVIGGLVGSLWALAGVLLFYSALVLQREEFKDQLVVNKETKGLIETQTKTLIKQQIEGTIFQLLSLLHKSMDGFEYRNGNESIAFGDAAFKKVQEKLSKHFKSEVSITGGGVVNGPIIKYVQIEPKSKEESAEWMWDALDKHFKGIDYNFRRIALQFYNLIIFISEHKSLEQSEKRNYINLIKSSISHVAFRQFLYYSRFRKPEPQKAIVYLNVHGAINYENMEGIEDLKYHKEILREHLKETRISMSQDKV
jgi:hypothetical protein